MDKDDNQLKITRQSCNVFVTCYSTSGELLYIKFTHYGMSNLGLYPDGIVPKNFYFQWPSRTEMRCMYKRLLKEGDGDNNDLRCPDILNNNLEIICSAIKLDKVDLVCA